MPRLTAKHSERLANAATPFCMDDQWFTRGELYNSGMLRRPENTARSVRELKRAMLSAETLIINRSYFVNTDAFHDLWDREADQKGLVRLLNSGAIGAFLLDDQGPEFEAAEERQTLNQARLAAWREAVRYTDLHCVRLDWDEAENRRLIATNIEQRFASRLYSFADAGASILAKLARGPTTLAHSSNYIDTRFRPTLDRLMAEEGRIARRSLYRELIIVDGSDLASTMIDGVKDYSHEIKQAIDLVYNTTMTDAIGTRPLVPADSPGRDVLSENGDIASLLAPDDMAALIVGLSEVLGTQRLIDAHVDLLAHLSVDAICEIRSSDSWVHHISAARAVASTPENENGRALVDEIKAKVKEAQASARVLAKEIIHRYGSAWKDSSRPLAAAWRLSARLGSKHLVDGGGAWAGAGISAMGSLIIGGDIAASAAAGGTAGKALGWVADAALGGIKDDVSAKLNQQLDLQIAKGVRAFTTLKLPRFELGDGTVNDVMRILKEHGAKEGTIADIFPAIEGHTSSLDTPNYG